MRGVLVRQERLPPAVRGVLAAHEFHLLGFHLGVNVLDANLARANVAASKAEVAHSREREFSQVSLLHAGGDERHRDVALHAVHANPRRNQRERARDGVHQSFWGVIFVLSRAPKLVETRAADHERRVEFQTVGAKVGVFEKFSEGSRSRSMPTLGRSGIMWTTTLNPASLASSKHFCTAATVCPRLVSRATSS